MTTTRGGAPVSLAAEIPAEAADLLQAVYTTLRDDAADGPARVRAALAPIMGRVHCNMPVRSADCRHAADLLTCRAELPGEDEAA
jgi:hypothetical protein